MIDQTLRLDHAAARGCPFAEEVANDSVGYAPLAPLRLVGMNFRTADLALRGRVSFSGESLKRLLARLMDAGIAEAVVLSTCNRTEIVFFGDDHGCVSMILAEASGVPIEELEGHLYCRTGHLAAEHLFRVCSGMDSAVLGETDILAQIKQALAAAQEIKSVGPWLNLLFRHAFAASKRVRSETDLCRGITSLGSLAVREASSIMEGLKGKSVLLLGAGKLSERIAKDIVLESPASVTVANRTLAAAKVLADRHGVDYCTLEESIALLSEVDIVFSAVGSSAPILDRAHLAEATDGRKNRPLVIVDLGVPANVTPDAKRLEEVVAVDVDHLIERCARNTEKRQASIPGANAIVSEAIGELAQAYSEREAANAIHALVRRCEEVREQNLAWAIERLGELDTRQRKVVEDLTLRMMRGLLESPIRSLKDSSFGPDERDVVLRLFEAGGDE